MRILLAAALLLIATAAPAQKEQLRFTLILSRHGIRPPLTTAAQLHRYSAEPWPDWEVPLGHLTPHGADALRQMGTWMRLDLARNGLFAATGCPTAIYLYSDTDERNISSTRSTFSGFAPGCDPLPVNTYVPGKDTRDGLFLPIPHTFPAPPAEAALAAMDAALGSDPDAALTAKAHPQLAELAHILAPDPAHPPATPITSIPVTVAANPSGDPIVSNHGPLPTASSLSEDFLLEYADAKPMAEVGWGRVDEAALRRLLALNVAGFTYNARTPFFARAIASNLAAHTLDTLDQAADPTPLPGALGPTGTKLVYISAHDTNLHAIAGLFGLHWTNDGVADDTPPDAQIVFELWQHPGSKQYTVRIKFRAQTLSQLRSASPLTLAAGPGENLLIPPGCHSATHCAYADFRRAALALLDPTYVKPGPLPTQLAP
jgi:4-phytase/acid phosphatase